MQQQIEIANFVFELLSVVKPIDIYKLFACCCRHSSGGGFQPFQGLLFNQENVPLPVPEPLWKSGCNFPIQPMAKQTQVANCHCLVLHCTIECELIRTTGSGSEGLIHSAVRLCKLAKLQTE